jgi:hypothetical protein
VHAKNGLLCVAACKHCKGCDCENPSITSSTPDEVDGEDVLDDPVVQVNINNNMSDDGMEFAIPWVIEEEVYRQKDKLLLLICTGIM